MDARSISHQLDALVLERLSLQTQLGGSAVPLPSTSAPAAAPASTEDSLPPRKQKKDQLTLEAQEEGISKRQLMRELKHQKVASQRLAKREKLERLRRRAEKNGEEVA